MSPTILAINPTDAAALDLTQVGADNLYLFTLRTTGQASPLFGLRLIEATEQRPSAGGREGRMPPDAPPAKRAGRRKAERPTRADRDRPETRPLHA
jgi:hypothetical protein